MKSNYFLFCIIILLVSSCKSMLYVVPSSVEGKVADKLESKMLESPSVLDIDGYFVWGGSVVKGKDGRYHMLFSLWESGGNVNPKNDGSSFNVQISLIKK